MEKIEWSNDYSVGVKILDEQHKQLVDLINTLFESTDQDGDSHRVLDILAEMRNYARTHFDTEEELMQTHRYADLEDHKRLHREFERKTDFLVKASKLPVDNLPDAVLVYLRNWWLNHILIEDMKYKDFLRK